RDVTPAGEAATGGPTRLSLSSSVGPGGTVGLKDRPGTPGEVLRAYSKRQGEDVVRVVRRRGDVQEEHQVNAHLGTGQPHQGYGNARPIDDMGPSHPERGDRKG